MGIVGATAACFRKYAVFSGRSRRAEYWWFFCFVLLAQILLSILEIVISSFMPAASAGFLPFAVGGVLTNLFFVGTLLPSLAVGWRRLHDIDKPGWLYLMPYAVLLISIAVIAGDVTFLGVTDPATGVTTLPSGVASALIPAAGAAAIISMLLLLWWLTRPTHPGDNRFGPEPPR